MNREVSVQEQLKIGLRSLTLSSFLSGFEEAAIRAASESASYESYLLDLVDQEVGLRASNRIARLMKASGLPREKTLASFDRSRLSKTVDRQLELLLDGTFLDRHENVLAFGSPGSGKTHLVCALANELIHRGRQLLYIPCSTLVQTLLAAKRDYALPERLKALNRFEALLIDDIGYVEQSREEMEVLFTLLASRYERGAVLVTSNLPFSQWERIFKDPMTTAAAVDRLVHHSVILEMNMSSYRLHEAKSAIKPEKQEVQPEN